MTTLTEGKHAGEFIVSEANGHRSRATATVLSGQNLVAGQVVEQDANGKLKALSDALDTGGDLVSTPVGILYDNVDASDGDVAGAVYIARDAEVNGAELTYPDESSADGQESHTIVALATLGIIVR